MAGGGGRNAAPQQQTPCQRSPNPRLQLHGAEVPESSPCASELSLPCTRCHCSDAKLLEAESCTQQREGCLHYTTILFSCGFGMSPYIQVTEGVACVRLNAAATWNPTVQGKAEMEVMRSIAEELGELCSGMKVFVQHQGGLIPLLR